MDVAKDLPSSNLKTLISEEWNLHRPDHWDPGDLMFCLWWSCFFLSPVSFGRTATLVQLCLEEHTVAKKAAKKAVKKAATAKPAKKAAKKAAKKK